MSLRREADRLILAVQFLTRLPTPARPELEVDGVARAARYFPLAGLLVGLICAAVWAGAASVWPGWPAAVLAVGAGALVTGALHEDGLADTADGLGGGQTTAQKLAIMKDSRIGVFGSVALMIVLMLKISLLARFSVSGGALALVAMHGGARAAAVVAMAVLPYAGDPETAKIKPAASGVRPPEVLIALVLGLWPLLFEGMRGAFALVLAGGAALGLAAYARRLVGGVTGDILGAVEQMAEVGLLLGLAAWR